ncbi:major tail protein [Bacillus sp. UNC438CL73TsuS30]|uniref:major tail protein n=1 Tax=Bacillus sp. UNC438CL73TsuS30 TaxID=1340434 RepID=UPI00047D70D8|nr:major tail protein [Bacillus sp. UNC438CL73TsuS30]
MTVEKSYKAATGVDEFYYAPLTSDNESSFTAGTISRVQFLQSIEVEIPQEVVRAYGDNKTAEIAVAGGNTTVTTSFHKVPAEDKAVLFGLEKSTDGIYGVGSEDNPPYVAVVFKKTYEDGSSEWVGLTKGKFMRSKISGKTKEDKTEFEADEVTGEFMDRYVPEFDQEKSVLFGVDAKGSTASRDALFTKVFGQSYPVAVLGA